MPNGGHSRGSFRLNRQRHRRGFCRTDICNRPTGRQSLAEARSACAEPDKELADTGVTRRVAPAGARPPFAGDAEESCRRRGRKLPEKRKTHAGITELLATVGSCVKS